MTPESLALVFTKTPRERLELFAEPLIELISKYEINTPLRWAHFLAQIGHESGELRYTRELSSGEQYEGRKDLGNDHAGDGVKYKGRGLIQLTGRNNYKAFDQAIGAKGEVLKNPDLLTNPRYAAEVAGWYWDLHKLNGLADQDNLKAITRKINGGTNGLEHRRKLLNKAKSVMFSKESIVIKEAQKALNYAGIRPSLIADGLMGPLTKKAVEEFQRLRGLPITGAMDSATIPFLRMYL